MPIQVRHLAPLLQVFDMPTALRFYCDVLGFEIVSTDQNTTPPNYNWVLLRLDGLELMLNTAYEEPDRPPKPIPTRVAAHKDATIYFACPDVDGVYAHLRAKDVNVKPPKVAPYGMKQLYLTDPDGFGLCFQWPADPPALPS